MAAINILKASTISYNDTDTYNVVNNLVTNTLYAAKDESSQPQDLIVGASKDVALFANQDLQVLLGSTNTFTVKDASASNSLKVLTTSTTTTVTTGSTKDLLVDATNLALQKTLFSTNSNYQVLFTEQARGFELQNDTTIEGSKAVSGSISVGQNITCNSNVFAQNFNVFRFRDSNATLNNANLTGYSFVVNSRDQLELLKYTSFGSSKRVTKRIAIFGQNMTQCNERSDTNYLSFDQFGISTSVNGNSAIADSNITSAQLSSNSILTQHITSYAVQSSHIANSNITASKLAQNIPTSKFTGSCVTSRHIASGAILGVHVTDSNITSNMLSSDLVTSTHIPNGVITSTQVANNAITTTHITDSNITSSKLVANVLTTATIADSNITSAKIPSSNVQLIHFQSNCLTTPKFATPAVNTSLIPDNTVSSRTLAGGCVLATHITASNIISTNIAANSIKNLHIVDGIITTRHFAKATVTPDKLASAAQAALSNAKTLQIEYPTSSNLSSSNIDVFVLSNIAYTLPTQVDNGKMIYMVYGYDAVGSSASVIVRSPQGSNQEILTLSPTKRSSSLANVNGEWLVVDR